MFSASNSNWVIVLYVFNNNISENTIKFSKNVYEPSWIRLVIDLPAPLLSQFNLRSNIKYSLVPVVYIWCCVYVDWS